MPIPDLPSHPTFAIVGAGAVGGYYGARLAQNGHPVHFLMRSSYETVQQNGWDVRSIHGDFHLREVNVARDSREIGPCDVVIVTLKATSNSDLATILPPLLHENTIVLTLQNGLGNEAFLAGIVGQERVMGGLCFVCINQTAPGVIEHYAQGLITIGELSGPPLPRTLALADLFAQAGIPCKAIDSLDAARWRKLVWNIPFNGLAIAAGGIDTSQILASPPLEQLARDLMAEVIETASHLGHKFPEGLIDDQIARTKTMGSYQPSSLIDWKNGRSVEIDAIWQLPCQVAMESGQPMPRVGVLLRLLQHLAHPDHA